MLASYGFQELENCEKALPVKSKMAVGLNYLIFKSQQLNRRFVDFDKSWV